jgi:hypothetical protein
VSRIFYLRRRVLLASPICWLDPRVIISPSPMNSVIY